MDGASWPARWPPLAPASTPPALPPPSRQQMDGAALRHLLRPLAMQQAAAVVPEQHPVGYPPTAQPSHQPTAGVGPSSGSLAQVPGSYSTFGAASDLKAMFDKLSASNAAAVVDLTGDSPLGGVTSLSKYPRHGLSASSSNEQSTFGAQFLNKTANGMGTFTGEGSANEGITRRGIQFQDSSAHTLQMLPFKSTPHHPAPLGHSIRVSCLNIGGEFFMGGAGLFGVICLCHRLKMSIAKFCEHAGGPAQKAGEIVRVENGMSIAQWFKFWAGVGGSFSETKWDWPEWACLKNSPEEYWLKSLPSRNNSIGQIGPLGGYGNITGPLNKQVYSNDLYTDGRGCTNVEKIVRRPDETKYKKGIDVHGAFTNNSSSPQSSMIVNLGLDKDHKVSELDLSPHVMPTGALNFNASIENRYNGNQLAHNYGIFLGKNVDVSLRNHGPSSTGVLNRDSRACRPDVPHKTFQDSLSIASNTELKLGQASCHQSMSTLFPSVQSTVIEFQRPQSHTPLIPKNPCPKQTTKVNRSIEKHGELPFVNGNKDQHEVVNGTKHSEGDALTDGTTNNSFISLFLSHLERNSAPEPIDDILNSNEHCIPKALDSACSSDHPEIASGRTETRDGDNHSKLAPSIIHMKGKSDIISLSAASGGYNPQELPHSNNQEPLMYGDCQLHLLPSQPDAGISKICGVSCPTNCRSCAHVGNKSHQNAHAEIGVPCFYDKMVRTHKTLECVDHFCTHGGSRAFAKLSYENGKCCCPSRKLLPSFCQNDSSKMEKSICDCCCCCKIQEDVSKLGVKPGHLCRTQFSCDDGPILANKHTCKGLDGFTCSTLGQRSSLYSGEHFLQCSCCSCPVDGFHHRRGRAIDDLTKNTLFDTLSMKERDHCCHGSCCYSAVPKCLPSCGFTKHSDVRTDHTIPECKYQLQMLARCSTSGENGKSASQCLSNKIAGGSISQASLLKDVSNEATNQPSVATMERLKNVSEASVDGGSKSKAVTEKKGAYRDSVISKGQPNFGFSSGSSSAVVTKFPASPEFKNITCCNAKHNKRKNLCDEASRIEECSVSSYVPTSPGCEKALSSLNMIPGSHLGPSRVKRKCNQVSDGSRLADNGSGEHCFGLPKKTRTLRCSAKHLESDDYTRTSSPSSQNVGSQPQNEGTSFSCRVFRTKRKYASMYQNKPVKRLHSQKKISKDYDEQQDDKANFLGGMTSYRKRQVEDVVTQAITEQHGGTQVFARKLPKYVSLNCIINEPKSEDACSGSARMDSTLIATGIANDNRKPPKIVPLNLILKKAKKCHAVKPICKAESVPLSKENSSDWSVDSSDCSVYKSSVGNENCSTQAEDEMQVPKKRRYSLNDLRPHIEDHCRSPCDAIGEDEPAVLKQLSIRSSRGIKNRRGSVSLNRIKRLGNFSNRPTCNFGREEENAVQAHEVNATRYSGRLSSDASCCVCGILNLEPCNQLIECSKCYIKVHQGCYGVLKVPRGQWFCRPCKANTRNTVCVLCGHGGGAMTRALKHKNILKSLLKGLTMSTRAKGYADSFGTASTECTSLRNPIDNAHEDNINTENITSDSWTSVNRDSCLLGRQKMQWVHMVCGLWTPGTKCPNATTMSAFDVSGASPAKKNTVCSLCSRTGGSFIKCRDLSCSVLFHPWCGHQRGLLQSEPEGENNENVGFYGRCLDHAIDISNHVNPKNECLRSSDWTCARTKGFKGRKGEDVNHRTSETYCGEFSVSQEQINAWLYINGSKSCGRGQMEYTHYKQLKGRKHLVVYKSGIHGLGLYTSMFIPRGSMVVEYVGEIVGQRVADKREIEYQSGKRQQYKTACYFFKIDREHIIDATRKGGIARFVNHSCQPNCVAKIISVRNEKKVVFFAERHINPGEEITYDYHFNREDEGQRIPCLCRSRYCRRYLN